jgi:ribose/xylose/arabinose/galactoside ABC-type transport system permease subunit
LDIQNGSSMKYVKVNSFIVSLALAFILAPSFALISSSQSNDTLSDDTLSDDTLSNDTFSSLSRQLAQNQSGSDDGSNDDND